MEESSMNVSEAFAAIIHFGLAMGMKDMGKRPGLWEQAVDEHWLIVLNPHKEVLKSSQGIQVPFGRCYIEFNGWPAGMIDPYGGVIAAGELANEAEFIAALKVATEKAKARAA